MKKLLFFLVTLIFVSGCSLTIRPNPSDPDATVNLADRSITITRQKLKLTVRVQDVAVGGYSLEKAIASFYLDASYHGSQSLTLPLTAFLLHDDQGRIYVPVQPDTVSALLNPLPGYLVPFPFVGYLDMTGLESYRASSAMASARPYVGQGLPAAQPLGAFDGTLLASGNHQTGVIFFEIDLHQVNSVRLLVHPVGVSDFFEFPFIIER